MQSVQTRHVVIVASLAVSVPLMSLLAYRYLLSARGGRSLRQLAAWGSSAALNDVPRRPFAGGPVGAVQADPSLKGPGFKL